MKSILVLMRKAVPVAALTASLFMNSMAQTTAPRTLPFEFRSSFWLNLHHFLFEQALLRKQAAAKSESTDPYNQLSSEQQQLWNAALDYYTMKMIKRDFVHDEEMVKMNDQLGEASSAPDLSKSGLSSELAKVLESVAPIYRARWWSHHDKANRFWIAVVTPMVQQFGETLIKQLTNAFKAKWPVAPIRVDVAEYANWAGAYTTFSDADKVHTTVASIESGNQGFAALELVFHEASHWMVGPFNGAVARAIARESRSRNKPIPRDLWHALLFYTVGEITKRNLREYGVSNYTPMVYLGLFTRAWPNYQRPLEVHWQPYLDGKVDFDKAMADLINAV